MVIEVVSIQIIYDNILAFCLTFLKPSIYFISAIMPVSWNRGYISNETWQFPIFPHF